MAQAKSVLLVSEDASESEEIKKGLYNVGVSDIHQIPASENFLTALNNLNVDFIVLDVAKPDDDLFERISVIDSHCPTPVICFSKDSDSEVIANSVKAGVSAYIVDGKSADRIEPIMEVAFQRFKACQAMRKELLLVKDKLSERAVIEKAKGLLIEEKGMSENEAYSAMRKMAMNQGKRISEIAHEIHNIYMGLPSEDEVTRQIN